MFIPLRLDLVRTIGKQLNKYSSAQDLLLDQVVLLYRKHCLNIMFGIIEDDSVPLLSTTLGSDRLDLNGLNDGVFDSSRAIAEDIVQTAGINAPERFSRIVHGCRQMDNVEELKKRLSVSVGCKTIAVVVFGDGNLIYQKPRHSATRAKRV